MALRSREELAAFVRSLDVPEERRGVIEAELDDHVQSCVDDLAVAGLDPADAEHRVLTALGADEALRAGFERASDAFGATPRRLIRAALRIELMSLVSMLIASVLPDPFAHVPVAEGAPIPSPLAGLVVFAAIGLVWPAELASLFGRYASRPRRAPGMRWVHRLVATYFVAVWIPLVVPFLAGSLLPEPLADRVYAVAVWPALAIYSLSLVSSIRGRRARMHARA